MYRQKIGTLTKKNSSTDKNIVFFPTNRIDKTCRQRGGKFKKIESLFGEAVAGLLNLEG